MKRVPWKRGIDLRDEKGIYSYRGRRYVSVTTVLGPYSDFVFVHNLKIAEKAKELVYANADKTKVKRWKEVPDQQGWGELVWQLVECDAIELLLDTDWLKNEGFRFLKCCADRGSVIHDLMADYARGMDLEESQLKEYLSESIITHNRSCAVSDCLFYGKSMLAFLDHYKPRIYISEASVFNDAEEYAGTLDMVMANDGQFPGCTHPFIFGDLKTSEAFKRAWAAQISGYKHSDFAVVDDDGVQIEWQLPTQADCASIQILEDRYIFRHIPNDEAAYNDFFLPALKAHKASEQLTLPPHGKTTKLRHKPELELVEVA